MEYGETLSRDQNRNDEPADDIEEKKSSLKNSKEKTHVKAISGKRKDQKSTSFLWTRYLAVIHYNFMVPKPEKSVNSSLKISDSENGFTCSPSECIPTCYIKRILGFDSTGNESGNL